MDREDLKEIILNVLNRLREPQPDGGPAPACLFGDDGGDPCDSTTRYAIDEED